ncbi:hypothetical protein BU23DRAFT_540639 [Bimuria novae-zelandiae CBS 107.79]|uniref:Zn(2)-C6 fungal-type domain-containing protein n=1 Tax=Bimuria novae-zelandiae CBS 107.79 TaxID=1447943 RepID=A0A6A5V0P3_9PLEO|nr:hypothetical protein BU23DRAFT_540639 [Bimuria novae-zelandiae CBS 107.79]
MAGHTRTRTGCWTCREAGYKCDEQRPSCGRCARLKKECKGYGVKLKWKVATSFAPALRKHRTQRSKPVENTSLETPGFTTSLGPTVSVASPPSRWGTANLQERFALALGPMTHPFALPDLSFMDQRLMQYWIGRLSSLISLAPRDGGASSFQLHLTSMLYTRGALQSTVLSMAATHLGLVTGDTVLRFNAYKHQRDAIQRLQQLIQDPKEADQDPTLATVMMMQVSARLFGDEEEAHAANHLTGAKAMISRRRARTGSNRSSSEQFLTSLFAYHDILSSVSRGSPPLDTHESDFDAVESAPRMRSTAMVLQVVARISEFHERAKAERLFTKQSELQGENYHLGAQIQQTLLNMSFDVAANGLPEDQHINLTAEAYRHAAFIYLYRVWFDMGAPNPTTVKHVQECLACIKLVLVDSPLASSHTWPLFTAGCETFDTDQRQFVRERFLAMYESRKFPSLKRVLRDVEDVWAAKDAEQIMGGMKLDCIQVILRRRGREVDLA